MSTVGRPHIDGSGAGTAPRLEKITVTISAEDVEYLRRLGNGNLSAGIRLMKAEYISLKFIGTEYRRLVAESRKTAAESQP